MWRDRLQKKWSSKRAVLFWVVFHFHGTKWLSSFFLSFLTLSVPIGLHMTEICICLLYGAVLLPAWISALQELSLQTKFSKAAILDSVTSIWDCSWKETAPTMQKLLAVKGFLCHWTLLTHLDALHKIHFFNMGALWRGSYVCIAFWQTYVCLLQHTGISWLGLGVQYKSCGCWRER